MFYYLQIPISHFAKQCNKRLEKMVQSGPKKGQRKPNIDEIEQAKVDILSFRQLLHYELFTWNYKPLISQFRQFVIR